MLKSMPDINGLTNPVKVDNEKLNKVKDHQAGGNAPFLMFMPIWIPCNRNVYLIVLCI